MLNFYLYSVTSISLAMLYVGILVFVRGSLLLAFGTPDTDDAIRILANGMGYALVSVPLWWAHWVWLRGQFNASKGDDALWNQFYLFTVVCLNAMILLFAGAMGVSRLLKYLFGTGDPSAAGVAGAGVLIASLLLSLGMWRHHWHEFTVRFGKEFKLGKVPDIESKPAAS